MWKNWVIGQRLKYAVDEFDGVFACECTVTDVRHDYAIAISDDSSLVLTIDDDTEHLFSTIMSRKQVIEQMEALLEYFDEEYHAVPICMTEAIRLLKEAD